MQFETERQTEAQETERAGYGGTQLLAWVSLLGALAIFVVGVVFIPQGIVGVLGVVRESVPTQSEVVEGTVLYHPPVAATWQQLPPRASLDEGTRLRTDDRSRVFLQLVDGSTALLYTDTELGIQRMQMGRFNRAVQDTVLRLFGGRATFGVSQHPLAPDRRITLLAGGSRLDLAEGSFGVELSAAGVVDLSVRTGYAIVSQGARTERIGAGQRARLGADLGIEAPLPLNRHLIQDSSLAGPLADTAWMEFVATEAGPHGTVQDGDGAVRFIRRGGEAPIDRHGESGIFQELNRDLRDYVTLRLRADLRADFQSLSGGGTAGTEYPLMIRLTYLDTQGREQIWARGFYYQNDEGLSTLLGQQIPQGQWFTFEQTNLLTEIQPTPVFLRRIEVLGSGWAFESAVRSIELSGH